jgi:hypothetical protein
MKKLIIILLLISNIAVAQYQDFEVDALVSPKQKEITIIVGGEKADIHGFTNWAIQLAINSLPNKGGIVKLNEGTFLLKDAVHIKSNTKRIGSGSETILKRAKDFSSKLIDDADYGELKLMVEDASEFEIGM